jgi:hypothetical protein
MKSILIILLIIPNLLSSQIDKLKGKVKSTSEKIIFVKDSIQNYKLYSFDGDYGHSGFGSPKITIDRFHQNWYNEAIVHYINNVRNFNEKGLLISEDWFDKNDKITASYEYQYTEFDSLSKVKEFNQYDGVYRITNTTYDYYKNPQSTLGYWSNDSNNFSLSLYEFDNSKKVKEQFLSERGMNYELFYIYNKDKLLNKVIIHKPTIWANYDSKSYYEKKDSIGTYYCPTIKFYNDKKQLIEENTFSQPEYDNESKPYGKAFFQYDEAGNCTEVRNTLLHSELVFIRKKTFDKKNRVVKESDTTLNFKDGWNYKKEFVYNKKDELIRLIINSNSKITYIDFKYKYDNYDNWIEQTKYVDNKKLFVWKREIEYYDK